MMKLRSRDGTLIALEKKGSGPPVILIDGAFGSRRFGPNEPLADLLSQQFTVITYDRRGRGESGDTKPYAARREVEDLDVIISELGGSAYVYGISSGANLAIEAAARLNGIKKLALYEATFVVDDSRAPVPAGYLAEISELIEKDRRGDAIRLFMRKGVGLPAIVVAMMRLMPAWSKMKAVAHTLPYDTMLTHENQQGKPLPAERWATVAPGTLVINGGKSPVWMRNATKALARALPEAQHRVLDRQTHLVKPQSLAPVLVDYFSAQNFDGQPPRAASARCPVGQSTASSNDPGSVAR